MRESGYFQMNRSMMSSESAVAMPKTRRSRLRRARERVLRRKAPSQLLWITRCRSEFQTASGVASKGHSSWSMKQFRKAKLIFYGTTFLP